MKLPEYYLTRAEHEIFREQGNALIQALEISVRKKHGDYFAMLASLRESHHPKVLFFLISNIGNMTDQQATDFIYKTGSNLAPNDKLCPDAGLRRINPGLTTAHSESCEFYTPGPVPCHN